MQELVIKNLHVSVEGKEILKGVNLVINKKDNVALLGPNGHGKSTLLAAIMGNPKYEVTEGEILIDGKDVLKMSVDERSKNGIFLAMQYPPEVPGVVNADFLKSAINAHRNQPIKLFEFYRDLDRICKEMNIPLDLANRFLNEGFSGGEKKRNEILQMMLLKPDFAMLDEIDSGLDVDAINIVSKAINELEKNDMSFLIVSHYARLYELIHPTRAAIMINGRIVLEGDTSLIEKIDKEGYEFLKKEYNINIKKEESPVMNSVSLGSCAVKQTIK